MKKIILNTSGNVGKSAIAREVFISNMDNYNLVEIETQNSSHKGFNVKCTTLDTHKKLAIQFIRSENLIIDLGNTEVFETLDYMVKNDFLSKIDKYIVPLIIEQKIWEDTTVLIQTLINHYSVDPKKIYIIFNRARREDNDILLSYESKLKKLNINVDSEYKITELEVFKTLGTEKKLISELISDTNFEKMIKATDDEDEQERLFDLMIDQKPLKELKAQTVKIRDWIIS